MKVTKETIARTIVLALALINQILAIVGRGQIPIAENDIYQIVSLAITIGSSIVAWWKNNSFTQPALRADALLETLKKGDY